MKKYFYTDENGKTRKYVYCIRGCPEPYLQKDIGTKIYKATNTTFICQRCIRELNLSREQTIIEQHAEINELETTELVDEAEEKPESYVEPENPEVQQNEFFAIAIKCNDGTYYCGTTSDVKKAMKYHNAGSGGLYTKIRRPVVLIEAIPAFSLDEAKKIKNSLLQKYKN